jgi:hypothetical protein
MKITKTKLRKLIKEELVKEISRREINKAIATIKDKMESGDPYFPEKSEAFIEQEAEDIAMSGRVEDAMAVLRKLGGERGIKADEVLKILVQRAMLSPRWRAAALEKSRQEHEKHYKLEPRRPSMSKISSKFSPEVAAADTVAVSEQLLRKLIKKMLADN